MNKPLITVEFTPSQFELLRVTILYSNDCGPVGEEWKSEELKELDTILWEKCLEL